MVDFFAAAQRIISMVISGTELVFIVWLSSGGIIYVLRAISFWIDCTIVNCIGAIYGYFMTLLKGTMFNKTLVDAVMKNVYIFIGVFIFFRVAMLLIKYIMNPEMIADQKAGANALVKRVIIGMMGIIFVPTIFDYGMKLQSAIIEDQLIQQLFIPSDMIDEVSKQTDDGGKGIGTTILSGFINPSSKAPDKIKNEYKKALNQKDLSSISFNSGGFLGVGYSSYDYSYFYLISTFVLGYVLYLMLKYCLDIVVRFFKLFLFQLIAPIAMVEYMANGADDGVFKNWKNAVLGSYLMLFTRIMSIWFVLFVMTLLNGNFTNYSNGSLLAENDYLLKALIMIGLLAFMIDLPKIIGNIFGIDLEQESSAAGLLKSFGGMVKGVGLGAVALGGAAVAGGFKQMQNAGGSAKSMLALKQQKKKDMKAGTFDAAAYNQNKAAIKDNFFTGATNARKATNSTALKSLANNSKVFGAAYGGATGVTEGIKSKEQKAAASALENEERAYRQHQMETSDQINAGTTTILGQQTVANFKLDNLVDNSAQTLTQTVNIEKKVGTVSGNIEAIAQNTETTAQQTVNIEQKLGTVSGNVEAIAKNTETTAQQTVNIDQKLGKISSDVSTIADNTEVSAEQTIDLNQKLGNISTNVDSIAGNTEVAAEETLGINQKLSNANQNNDIETLNN